jgi:predicted flavoprotein YhiN
LLLVEEVDLNEVDSKTLQHKTLPNLFFAGEVLDIDAITGGYNFQAAWTTGFVAAKAILAIQKEDAK